jgi:hypothetical protein
MTLDDMPIPARAARIRGADTHTLLRMQDHVKSVLRTTRSQSLRVKAEHSRERIATELRNRGVQF